LTYEVFQKYGSVKASVDWFTSLFSGVKAVYAKEGIPMNIKSIYVWTTDDGYSNDAAQALNQLTEKRANDPAFTANFTHLVRGQSNNLSGIAYVGGMCIKKYNKGFSAVLFDYAKYPAYSWSVMVLSHELGHNMGSPHTHSCSWAGGALDNCYTTEGGCPPGPPPTNGGTVMSYCHMKSYGINFANGFGSQPGNLIRKTYNESGCLGNCAPVPPGPTCNDGVKNGDETGIDCGGSCPPCPVTPPPGDPLVSGGKPATLSTSYMPNSFPPSKGNDGITGSNNFFHTGSELNPWWQVDLGTNHKVSKIVITNRGDCCGNRLKRFVVMVTDFPVLAFPAQGWIYKYDNPSGLANGGVITIPNLSASGRYVKIYVDNNGYGNNPLHLSEVSVYATPSTLIRDSVKVCRDSFFYR